MVAARPTAVTSFTKMAAGGFRHALPPILFKMSEQRRPPRESECGLMREWLQLSAQAGARWSCDSLRLRLELASTATCGGAKVTS